LGLDFDKPNKFWIAEELEFGPPNYPDLSNTFLHKSLHNKIKDFESQIRRIFKSVLIGFHFPLEIVLIPKFLVPVLKNE
jgi:hypothetical protein